MARIRTIKPEFPQSEKIGGLSRDARLLFMQLWTIADDEGRARAASRMLASLLYPYDDDAPTLIGRWLDELEATGCIRRYEVDGSKYLDIPNWLKHQKIDKPSKSRLPEFVEGSRTVAKAREASTTDLGPRTLDQDLGSKDQEPSLRSGLSETKVPDPPQRKGRKGYPAQFEEFWSGYPTDPNMSKKEAADVWSRLTPDDRGLAIASLTSFKAFCTKDPTYRPIHACRYLAKRRFEGHSAPAVNGALHTGPPPELEGKALADWVHEQRRKRNDSAGTTNGSLLDRGQEVRGGHDQGPAQPALVRAAPR